MVDSLIFCTYRLSVLNTEATMHVDLSSLELGQFERIFVRPFCCGSILGFHQSLRFLNIAYQKDTIVTI